MAGEWLSAQVAAGFDRTTSARLMEAADIAQAEADAGQSDAAWMLRRAAGGLGDEMGEALSDALEFSGAKEAGSPHAHALTERDWKASPWYRKEMPFRPDMTPTRARIMAENFDERRRRDRLIAAGSKAYDGWGDMALGFGASLLGSLPDPVNVIPFGGGLKAARTADSLGKAVLAGARAGAVEGAAATALADAVVLPDLASRGEDVDFADLALDVLAGGVLGSVFGAGGGALARRSAMRRGAEAVPGTLEAAEAVGPLPESPPARNADNDALRGTLTAGDRRTLAAATDAALDDIAAARPVDVGEALREAGVLERAYDRVRQDPLGGEPDEVLAAIRPEDIEAVFVHRGPAIMRDGQIVVQGGELRRATGSRNGYGLVKIIFAHGEGGNKRPDMPPVTREDVISLPRLLREYESRVEGDHRVWRIPREDGNVLRIVTRHGEEGPGARLVSMYVGPLKEGEEFSRRKPPIASSIPAANEDGDTGRGILISHPAGEQGAGHMTDSSMPDGAESVKPFAPDYSPAAEAPVLPVETWETPEAARLAEMEELAGQDEALRLGMEELEARGAADADDIAAARTENGDTGALGHEVMDCAWTVEV
ncbi:MAG TPA: hypothetical protein H9784_05155 [Candidatus Desulfovibrio intestinavium]|uniref:Uncharacterized protein n=1 Tax=Candidatus Desulfovibrio intestinavium TaxID=2838534 RepID=A0A9D2KRJ6_9BACT|nr:hypothetical protein [Candidatus Desulfovibrio intestinavium]